MGLAVLAAGALSGCCDCPFYHTAVARVRLLNWSEPAAGPVYFYFYRHGAPQVPEDALASGSFAAGDPGEAYAMKDGEIYIFQQESADDGFDVHVFVDLVDDGELTVGDMERSVTIASMLGDYVVEVDYSDFTVH